MKTQETYEINGYGQARRYAALAVMVLHFTGFALHTVGRRSILLSLIRSLVRCFPGVVVRFVLSGYLVTASYEKLLQSSSTESEATAEFLIKRAKRIFPPLWLCTILNVIVIVLLGGWRRIGTLLFWMITQITGIAWTPSAFKGFATGSLNGALWTIFVQLQLYILTTFFFPAMRKRDKKTWERWLVIALVVNLFCAFLGGVIPGAGVLLKILQRTFIPYTVYYLAGMYLYVHRDVLLPRIRKSWSPLLVIYLVAYRLLLTGFGYYTGWATTLLLPPLVIAAGEMLPERTSYLPDITYELFLCHWIVLNVFMHLNILQTWPLLIALLLFVALSYGAAYLVWMARKKYLEKYL